MTDLAATARAAATHCEARKTAYRQTKEGVVVSFVIHPNDVPDSVALAQLGTRYLLALVEIGDDEQPVSHSSPAPAVPNGPSTVSGHEATGAAPGRDAARERGKAAFAALPDMKKDVVKAALLIKDETFQAWILTVYEFDAMTPEERRYATDEALKERLEIFSKAEIGESRAVNARWHTLLTTYQRDTNQLAEIRG